MEGGIKLSWRRRRLDFEPYCPAGCADGRGRDTSTAHFHDGPAAAGSLATARHLIAGDHRVTARPWLYWPLEMTPASSMARRARRRSLHGQLNREAMAAPDEVLRRFRAGPEAALLLRRSGALFGTSAAGRPRPSGMRRSPEVGLYFRRPRGARRSRFELASSAPDCRQWRFGCAAKALR